MSHLQPDFFGGFCSGDSASMWLWLSRALLSDFHSSWVFRLTNQTISRLLELGGLLTGTRGDVALLVLLRRTQAGLTSVLGLWVGAGALAAADPPAAVPAALGPRAPRGPATVQCVAGHPSETKYLPCWTADNVGLVITHLLLYCTFILMATAVSHWRHQN